MELLIDGKTKDSVLVNSCNLNTYQFPLTDIVSGAHFVALVYSRASWMMNRKLYIDKLIIYSDNYGLLKPQIESQEDAMVANTTHESYALEKNYPNPFNPNTTIHYELPEETYVTIKIFNTLGREIRTLVNENKPAGTYAVQWDGRDEQGNPVVSGLYFYQIQAGKFNKTRKMLLMK